MFYWVFTFAPSCTGSESLCVTLQSIKTRVTQGRQETSWVSMAVIGWVMVMMSSTFLFGFTLPVLSVADNQRVRCWKVVMSRKFFVWSVLLWHYLACIFVIIHAQLCSCLLLFSSDFFSSWGRFRWTTKYFGNYFYEEKASNCWWGRHVRKRTRKMYSPKDDERREK